MIFTCRTRQGYYMLNRRGFPCRVNSVFAVKVVSALLAVIGGVKGEPATVPCAVAPLPSNKSENSVILDVNGNSSLICPLAYAYNVTEIRWMKDGKLLDPRRRSTEYRDYAVLRDGNTSILMLRNVSTRHTGGYRCITSRAGKHPLSFTQCFLNVTLSERPRILRKPLHLFTPPLQILTRDQPQTFHCYADGQPAPRLAWLKDDHVIGENQKGYRLAKRARGLDLTIMLAQANSGGNYTCLAVNRLGRAEYHIWAVLSEHISPEKPEVTAELPVVLVRFGHPANLTCRSTHAPKVYTISYWMYGGKVVENMGDEYSITRTWGKGKGANSLMLNLQVRNVTEETAGNYSCIVQTHIGPGSADTRLVIDLDRPGVSKMVSKAHTLDQRMIVIMICIVTGALIGMATAMMARYLRKRRTDKLMRNISNQLEFHYDVFITYSGKDYRWVRDELIPVLEANDIRYSIHCRDFEIGKAILDNMAEFIYKSRKIIAVMSTNYMSSRFCRGELEMALYRSTEMSDTSLILIRIDSVSKRKLPKSIRNRTFLDYYDRNERKGWKQRLVKHIQSPVFYMNSDSTSDDLQSSAPILGNAEC